MRFVSWSAVYEGSSDALYFDVLLPRVIRDLVATDGIQSVDIPDAPAVRLRSAGRSIEKVAEEACGSSKAYDVIFIHADTGGRNLERGVETRAGSYCAAMLSHCSWPAERCVTITPRHEMEAWLLADGTAVVAALGYNGTPAEVGLPEDAGAAENLTDPKLVLRAAIEKIAGRRRVQRIDNIFPAVAQRQRLDLLRRSASYANFEGRLRVCLRELRCIA